MREDVNKTSRVSTMWANQNMVSKPHKQQMLGEWMCVKGVPQVRHHNPKDPAPDRHKHFLKRPVAENVRSFHTEQSLCVCSVLNFCPVSSCQVSHRTILGIGLYSIGSLGELSLYFNGFLYLFLHWAGARSVTIDSNPPLVPFPWRDTCGNHYADLELAAKNLRFGFALHREGLTG